MRFDGEIIHVRSALVSPLISSVLVAGLLFEAGTVAAQRAPDSFEGRLVKVAAETETWPRLKGLSEEQRRDTLVFSVGNMLYAVFHEMGHAVISEMQLPVVGREEDAADSFAIVAGLKMMTNASERALIEAGKGWFLSEASDRKQGAITALYNSHAMNLQRAYQIVCFMVGANAEKFGKLADLTNLPKRRQKECELDYAQTAWSWEELLRPHRRKPDQAMTKIEVVYGEGKGNLDVYSKSFQSMQFLEHIANMASEQLAWRSSFTMEMATCGTANAYWSVQSRKVRVCYELVDSYLQLYLDFIVDPRITARMQAMNPPEPMR